MNVEVFLAFLASTLLVLDPSSNDNDANVDSQLR